MLGMKNELQVSCHSAVIQAVTAVIAPGDEHAGDEEWREEGVHEAPHPEPQWSEWKRSCDQQQWRPGHQHQWSLSTSELRREERDNPHNFVFILNLQGQKQRFVRPSAEVMLTLIHKDLSCKLSTSGSGEVNIQSIPSEVELVTERNGTKLQQGQGDMS